MSSDLQTANQNQLETQEEKQFALVQRRAQLLSNSSIVPKEYQGGGKEAIANCIIAEQMAMQTGVQTLTVMQNLNIIQGRPSWSSTYIISALNACKRFSPIRFEITELGPKKGVEYSETEWVNRQNNTTKKKMDIEKNTQCVAYATELATGDRIDGPPVSIETAVREGWFTKSGSKWQTMPELMLRYRSAAFFGRLYAPEILNGMRSQEEVLDLPPEPPKDITPHKGASSEDVKTEIENQSKQPEKQETEDSGVDSGSGTDDPNAKF